MRSTESESRVSRLRSLWETNQFNKPAQGESKKEVEKKDEKEEAKRRKAEQTNKWHYKMVPTAWPMEPNSLPSYVSPTPHSDLFIYCDESLLDYGGRYCISVTGSVIRYYVTETWSDWAGGGDVSCKLSCTQLFQELMDTKQMPETFLQEEWLYSWNGKANQKILDELIAHVEAHRYPGPPPPASMSFRVRLLHSCATGLQLPTFVRMEHSVPPIGWELRHPTAEKELQLCHFSVPAGCHSWDINLDFSGSFRLEGGKYTSYDHCDYSAKSYELIGQENRTTELTFILDNTRGDPRNWFDEPEESRNERMKRYPNAVTLMSFVQLETVLMMEVKTSIISLQAICMCILKRREDLDVTQFPPHLQELW